MNSSDYDIIISSDRDDLSTGLKDVWNYRNLMFLLVKRDLTSIYKQTILGPLWFILSPLMTTLVFYFVFSRVAKIETAAMPPVMFYFSGLVFWNYFSTSFAKVSDTFIANAALFTKVYFPRLVVPIAVLISNIVSMSIQLAVLIAFCVYYSLHGRDVNPNSALLMFPVLLLQTSLFALGLGLIVSSLTTIYKDFAFLVSFGVQLFMYATPVVYPSSLIPEKFRVFYLLNPIASSIEVFRHGLTTDVWFYQTTVARSVVVALLIFWMGMVAYNRVEKKFVDTV